jgi:hypothetical protein
MEKEPANHKHTYDVETYIKRARFLKGAWRIMLIKIAGLLRLCRRAAIFGLVFQLFGAGPAVAGSAVSCGGAAMLGGAQLNCSHIDPKAPAQLCTFSWALLTMANTSKIVEGSFLLPPNASNMQVYQASGFSGQLASPIILCEGAKH